MRKIGILDIFTEHLEYFKDNDKIVDEVEKILENGKINNQEKIQEFKNAGYETLNKIIEEF